MRIGFYLSLFLWLSASSVYGMKKISPKLLKKTKATKVQFKPFSTSAFNRSIFRKTTFPAKSNSVAATDNTIGIPQQNWWDKLTNFFSFNKNTQQPTLKNRPYSDLAKIKVKIAEEENNRRDTGNAYWSWKKWLAGIVGATLVGKTVAQMRDDESLDDPLLRPEFRELREFIELTKDPVLEKRWNICKADSKCHEVIRSTNLITIINQKPYIAIKDHQFDRLINAKILEYVIKKYNLNLIAIPQKSILFDGNSWKLISEVIKGEHSTDFSKEQLNQLMILVTEAGYSDIARRNCIIKNGKIYLIDTENSSFTAPNITIARLRNLSYTYNASFPENKKIIKRTITELERKSSLNELPSFYPKNVIKVGHITNLDLIREQAKAYENLINKGIRESGKGIYKIVNF